MPTLFFFISAVADESGIDQRIAKKSKVVCTKHIQARVHPKFNGSGRTRYTYTRRVFVLICAFAKEQTRAELCNVVNLIDEIRPFEAIGNHFRHSLAGEHI